MLNTQIRLTTLEATRLIKRLCTHWAHKFTVEVSEHQGHIDFGTCQCTLAANEKMLHIQLIGTDKEKLISMQTVVMDHLQRMTKTPLPTTAWSPVQTTSSGSIKSPKKTIS